MTDEEFMKALEAAAKALSQAQGEMILNEDLPDYEFSERHEKQMEELFARARRIVYENEMKKKLES